MPLYSIFGLAVGLSMDAMAVAASAGLAVRSLRLSHFLKVALLFGGFQALMPLLGWLLGSWGGRFVEAIDHWVIFVLLALIGGKMLWEARPGAAEPEAAVEPEAPPKDPFGLATMTLLAIATSIDAFAAGVALPLMKAPLVLTLIIIGCTTATLSGLGLAIGRRVGAKFGRKLAIAGGLLLVGLGLKVLIEHLTAA